MNLQGAFTAIVTPFKKGEVDLKKLIELVEIQITEGIDGIVPAGTTGESPTLTMDEHIELIQTVVKTVKKRCLVIAGTGANSTAEAVHLTLAARDAGADASLQVTPYYNKPTQDGLYRHFMEIADATQIPIVLYNIPGRCGVPIAVETIKKLSTSKLFVAVKEAGGNAERVSAIVDQCDITVLSGDDSLTLPMMSLGAKGVISVASNIIPSDIKRMVDLANSNDFSTAMKINKKFYPLFRDLFIETNPIPIKAAMAIKGMIEEEYRLPVCEISEKNRLVLEKTLKACGLI